GLAVQRAGAAGPPVHSISASGDHQPAARRVDTGRRRRDLVAPQGQLQERPANGPAAILAARVRNVEFAAAIIDWMTTTLVDEKSGLVRDGVRLNPDGRSSQWKP
ncbi:MAG: hypothetical protein ACJ786_27210, partial [Catenulispora sp.]